MAEVLGLVGFVPCETSGDQVRGPCPVHHSASPSGRSFSANLDYISTDASNADPPEINWTCTPRRPGWASSRPPSSCASGSTVRSPGCSKGHRPSPGQPVASLPPRGAVQSGGGGRLEPRTPLKVATKRFAPQPGRWSPVDRKSGALPGFSRILDDPVPTFATASLVLRRFSGHSGPKEGRHHRKCGRTHLPGKLTGGSLGGSGKVIY